jgi:hypothetical protein
MYGCVWLPGQTQPWLPRAKVGLFGCLGGLRGQARASQPYARGLAQLERANRPFDPGLARACSRDAWCGGPGWLPLAIVYKRDSHRLARVLSTVHSTPPAALLTRSSRSLAVSPPSMFLRLLPLPAVSTVGVLGKPRRFLVCSLIPLSYLCCFRVFLFFNLSTVWFISFDCAC